MLHTPVLRPIPDPGQLLSVTTLPGARPDRVVVEVVGEVDSYTVPLLELCLLSQATHRGLRELIVDLGRVTFLGAAAVSVLARAQQLCRMRGARLMVRTAGRRSVLPALQLTGLADLMDVDLAELGRGSSRRARSGTRPRGALAGRPRGLCR